MTLRQPNALLANIREWTERINALPPAPSGIRADHGVPYGRIFRQWDTNGRLWLWANAGMIQDLPRGPRDTFGEPMMSATFGIPVYSEADHAEF